MGIAVYTVGGCCAEEVADSTMCHILNLYRRVNHIAEAVRGGNTFNAYAIQQFWQNIIQGKNHKMPNKWEKLPKVQQEYVEKNLAL